MVKIINKLFFAIFILNGIFACTNAPIQEMSDARQAIKAARGVKAELYAPISIDEADKKLELAEESLRLGELRLARFDAIRAKEYAVQAYAISAAIEEAKVIWQTVSEVMYSEHEVGSLLKKAELAARQKEVEKAIYYANKARYQGELALNQAYLEQAKWLLNELDSKKDSLSPEQLAILNSAQQAYKNKEGKKAYSLAHQLK